MSHFWKVILLQIAILTICTQASAKSPSNSELRGALSGVLPSYIQVSSFSVEASQNLGNDVEPKWGSRFNAVIVAVTDLYIRESSENKVTFVSLSAKKDTKLDIFGKIYSTIYQGKWSNDVGIDGSPVDKLGLPLTEYSRSGNKVIVRGSSDEVAYFDNLQKERDLQREAEETRKAEQRAQEAEQEKLSKAEPYFVKGRKASKENNFDEAIAYYSKAIELNNKYWEAVVNRGHVYKKKGDLDKAMSDYLKADGLANDSYSKGWTNLKIGDLYDKKSNFDLAAKHYEMAIENLSHDKNPTGNIKEKSEIFNNVAWFYASCKDKRRRNPQKAIKYATEACVLSDWENPEWIDTLANAYAEEGNFSDAVKMQKKAIALVEEAKKLEFEQRLKLYMNKQKPD